MHSLKFFTSRNNERDIVLLNDGVAENSSNVTRVILVIGSVTLDTSISAAWITWPQTMVYPPPPDPDSAVVNGLRLKLGGQSIAQKIYTDCRLIIYDAGHPLGEIWVDDLEVRIIN